jgi:cobalt/nickel transport protein
MKKYLGAVALLVVFLVVFIPFASSSPDGLEKVAQSLGVQAHEPIWRGFMFDYSVEVFENPYVSTLLAGIFGTLMVLAASFVFGKVITKGQRRVQDK